ncbi:hypothetical protein Taro_025712 [Colocasia esculenta]|uniref:Retrotransposon gag domain-containing protein n=1 Tax=Colocasia esculenta TaxID=4460 RepID=A0A843VHD5_COLES|nr:hypothetical protein [Colocasia esculenta]
MWTFMVAVALNDRGVDANLCNLQSADARLTPTPTGESEEDVSRPSSSSEPRCSGAGSLYLGVCPRLLYFFSVLWKYGYASARSREADSVQVRYRYNGLGRGVPPQLVSEQEISRMADRRDWGGGGDDPEESTQRMIERIWESLMDIRARMDQQAPVPPVAVPPGDGETVPVAPVPPRVEVPFVASVPPPVLLAEEPVMQVEKFLRLQPPTYSGGPNPDTAEHWVHEIERVFATMRCPAADKVVLAAYQLRGFALEWWRLKMQTTFAGRTEGAITWSELLDVFNNTFFPIQVQQVKREQFRTLQQGTGEWLEDREACGVVESDEETPWCGAIAVGARGGFGVNRENSEGLSVRARRTFHDRRPVQSRAVAVQGRYLQLCSSSSSSVV